MFKSYAGDNGTENGVERILPVSHKNHRKHPVLSIANVSPGSYRWNYVHDLCSKVDILAFFLLQPSNAIMF